MALAANKDADPMVVAALNTLAAAEDAHRSAAESHTTPSHVQDRTANTVRQAKAMLELARGLPPKSTSSRSLLTPTNRFSEQSVGTRKLWRGRSTIEHHFNIDSSFRLLGPVAEQTNLTRQVHDFFNLVALIPIILLNIMNWASPHTLWGPEGLRKDVSLEMLWEGGFSEEFWWLSLGYFVFDFLFVFTFPKCVHSPEVVLCHHVAAMNYILVPKFFPEFMWVMGAVMSVEVNTWFLVARRAFNTAGEKPFTTGISLFKSFRLGFVSCCFYVSWICNRLLVNMYVLTYIIRTYMDFMVNSLPPPLDIRLVALIVQSSLLSLNIKWTVDLVRSKLKNVAETGL